MVGLRPSTSGPPDEDLHHAEFASLLIVLVLLLALGTAPSRLFQSSATMPPASVAMKGGTWIP